MMQKYQTDTGMQLTELKDGVLKRHLWRLEMKAFEDTLVLLDDFLSKTAYVAGNHITIADFAIVSTLATIQVFLDFSFDKYPRISSWMSKLKKEIPSYEEINEIPVKKHKEYLLAKRLQSSST
nr:glutathione S-transferase D5-like [Parasteatoda tepidariorum]